MLSTASACRAACCGVTGWQHDRYFHAGVNGRTTLEDGIDMNANEEIDQAYSMLTAHKYALTAITVTVLACMPRSDAEAWLKEFEEKSQRLFTRDNIAVDDIRATRIARDGLEMIEGFAEEVRRRLRGAQGD